jgi:UDP-3-O-[3-hydroxymyristoyl] glucosamine N-acyltransferase
MRRLDEKLLDAYLCALHFLAAHVPFVRVKRILYRLRGTRIGKGVDIATGVFIEESSHIEDNADIGPNVIIAADDSSYRYI